MYCRYRYRRPAKINNKKEDVRLNQDLNSVNKIKRLLKNIMITIINNYKLFIHTLTVLQYMLYWSVNLSIRNNGRIINIFTTTYSIFQINIQFPGETLEV